MNPSRKKFVPRSSITDKRDNTQSETTTDTFKRLDDLRTQVKVEHKKMAVRSSSTNIRLGAAALIVIVGMSGILIFSQIDLNDTGQSHKSYKNLNDGFQQDLSVSLTKPGETISFIYIGAEYCPYCAILRWAVVMALSQYGSFSGLTPIYSDESTIPTYSFVGSSYSSSIIDFQPCEVGGNTYNSQTQQYNTLEQMTSFQNSLFTKYGTGYIPFVCISGSIFRTGAGNYLNAGSFSGKTIQDVESQITAKSGTLYNQIKAESDNLVTLIEQVLTSSNSSSTSTTTQPSSYKLDSLNEFFYNLKENLLCTFKL